MRIAYPADSVTESRNVRLLVGLLLLLFAGVSARPYAGSWNDGSRLATVDSLVERGSFAIDDSVFVQVPDDPAHNPYPADDLGLKALGTRDRLLIQGHFYSDKPAVISLMMAGEYRLWRACGGPSFAENPGPVCWFMTLMTSGLAFLVAVFWMHRLFEYLELSRFHVRLLTLSFALATVAPGYLRHVNNHILHLAVTAGLLLEICRLDEGFSRWRLLWIGTLTGIGYNLDLGIGPVMVLTTTGVIFWKVRGGVVWLALAMAPWGIAQVAINYDIGGTLKPMNTVPEYSQWPGCPFTPENMTGVLRHGPIKQVTYSLALLFGKHGFIGHNLPLFLVFGAVWFVLRRKARDFPEMLYAFALTAGGYMMYSIFSNNYGGACLSVRWFVPFLATGFYFLAKLLKEYPRYTPDLCILTAGGLVLSAVMWTCGPWQLRMVPYFWQIQGTTLVVWGVFHWRKSRQMSKIKFTDSSNDQPRLAA